MLLVSDSLVALVVWPECGNTFVWFFFFKFYFLVGECSDGTGGCHDCTELPPTVLYTLKLPSSHYPFLKTITPRTNTRPCASSALPVNRDKEWIFLIAAAISFPVGIKINLC